MIQRTTIGSLAVSLVALLAVGPLSVLAVTQQDTGNGGTSSSTTNTNRSFTTNTNAETNQNRNSNASNVNAGANVNRGLDAAKLRVCQNREAAIQRIQERIARRAERHLEVFTAIAERVEAFYVRKGYHVENYAALVTEVNAKVAAATTQIESLKLRTVFSCTDGDPIAMVNAFKEQRLDSIAALKDLQAAVRNLIVAVKSAIGQDNGNASASNTNR